MIKMISRYLIVAHGDYDGIASAALLSESLGISVEELRVVFTQPFSLDQVEISDDVEQVYVVDLAVNNRDPEMTQRFYNRLGDRLRGWYDHHLGWEKYPQFTRAEGGKVMCATREKACAALMSYLLQGHKDDPRALDAIVADTREGELSETGMLIEHAMRADMSNDEIRLAATRLLMGDETQRAGLEAAAKVYAAIQTETMWLAKNYMVDDNGMPVSMYKPSMTAGKAAGVDYVGKVAVVDVVGCHKSEGTKPYDLTQLLLAGQKLATFAVAKTISPDDREMVTVATKSKTNLVELFDLPSGAPFRISLPANRMEEIVEKLHSLTSDERPCQCGSGEPWTICHANSPYCG